MDKTLKPLSTNISNNPTWTQNTTKTLEENVWRVLQSFSVTSTSIQSIVSLPGRSQRVVMAALLKKGDKNSTEHLRYGRPLETEAFIIQQASLGHNIIKNSTQGKPTQPPRAPTTDVPSLQQQESLKDTWFAPYNLLSQEQMKQTLCSIYTDF